MARSAGTRSRDGHWAIKGTFGASLYGQGQGFFVALELLAMVSGTHAAGLQILPPPSEKVRFRRRTHDFSRRLAVQPELLHEDELQVVSGPLVQETLRHLLTGLLVPTPWLRNAPTFKLACFKPYVGELVHYDAVDRPGGKISLERYNYRGAGGLAHKILRTDPDTTRLAMTREGLRELVEPSGTPLGKLVEALGQHDHAQKSKKAEEVWEDDLEADTEIIPTRWVEHLRKGVCNIVRRDDLVRKVTRTKRVDALMHWVPFCIAMHELAVARIRLDKDPDRGVPVDCQRLNTPVRDLSRSQFEVSTSSIYGAVTRFVESQEGQVAPPRSRTAMDGPRQFFSSTLHACGVVNAPSGQRFFCLRPEILETIVLALVSTEVEFGTFCRDVLHRTLGLVVDDHSAAAEHLVEKVDRSLFIENEAALEEHLRELGLLVEFSDMTRMVRYPG